MVCDRAEVDPIMAPRRSQAGRLSVKIACEVFIGFFFFLILILDISVKKMLVVWVSIHLQESLQEGNQDNLAAQEWTSNERGG